MLVLAHVAESLDSGKTMKSPTVGHPRLTYQGAKELYDNWDKLNPS
jgi:hypothetical protein